jgi:predicted O-methyltransferase YrrM
MASTFNGIKGRSPLSKIGRSTAKRIARYWAFLARRCLARGDVDGTIRHCRKAIAISDQCNRAYRILARAMMPGDDYRAVLTRIHRHLAPRTYLEIGVQTGASLALAAPDVRVVGIDPNPRITNRIDSLARLYPMTSDDFFARFDLLAELGASRLSLAYIDGLHLFEQVLKDFANIERYADADTVVLIHDCFPVARQPAERECRTSFWCGDVWKVIPCLMQHRPDLVIRVIPTYPSGLALVTRLDPGNRLLVERYDRLLAQFMNMPFGRMESERDTWTDQLLRDWPAIAAVLPAAEVSPPTASASPTTDSGH